VEDGLPRNGTSAGLQAAHIALAGEGRVFGLTVFNSNASAQYILVFDRSTIPSAGATADIVLKAPGADVLGVNWIPGRWFRSGCVLCNSSTAPTLTAGAADCLFDVQYADAAY
jgi:hypothetical protein